MAGTAEWSPNPDKVTTPTLWYVGADDKQAPLTTEARDTAARLGVETHVIPDADHVASFRRTDDVLAFVQPFLERHRS